MISSNYFNKKEIIKILENKKERDVNNAIIRKLLNVEIWFNVFFNKKMVNSEKISGILKRPSC